MQDPPFLCGYSRQTCRQDAACGPCLAAIDGGSSAGAIARGGWRPECHGVLTGSKGSAMSSVRDNCMLACETAVLNCVVRDPECARCLNGSALTSNQSAQCAKLRSNFISPTVENRFGIDAACAPCAAAFHQINAIVIATAVIGAVSGCLCLAIVATIVAHGRDRIALRDRLIIGLMLANTVCTSRIPRRARPRARRVLVAPCTSAHAGAAPAHAVRPPPYPQIPRPTPSPSTWSAPAPPTVATLWHRSQ